MSTCMNVCPRELNTVLQALQSTTETADFFKQHVWGSQSQNVVCFAVLHKAFCFSLKGTGSRGFFEKGVLWIGK
jgi:hypothetical protein